MGLSILSINDDDNNNKDNVFKCFERPRPEIVSTLMWNRGTKHHVKIPDFLLSKICDENAGCNFECNDNCNGKEKCNNKRIQRKQWKNVKKRDSGNQTRGFGLLLEEGCKKNDFIIKYTGTVTKKGGSIYSMKKYPPELKGKRKKRIVLVYIHASNDDGLARYINHYCNSYNGMSKDCRACVFLQ
jgi:hypothetical protein